jgi:ribose transport system ATP-binding protein
MDEDTKLSEANEIKKSPLIEAKHFRKVYYPTIAVADISMTLNKGDILALVGANGAGKSTFTKALSGVIRCDEGELFVDGQKVDLAKYSPAVARRLGIRVVHQELSLCKNLTVYENFYVEQSQEFKSAFGWRAQARKMAREAIDNVFPDNGIDVNAGLNSLSIAQQQMVEIARATYDKSMKLLVLDEPTSSLPELQTEQLMAYLTKTAKEGMTYIYISHRLKEIMTIANRVFIMQNGNEKWQGKISDTSEEHMVRLMGEGISGSEETNLSEDFQTPEKNDSVSVAAEHYSTHALKDLNVSMVGGEIVGLTGLEGNGQLDFLKDILLKSGKKSGGLNIKGRVAFVAGDRKKEGIFPLWSISDNLVITKAAKSGVFKHLSQRWLDESVGYWYDKLHIKSDGTGALITSLSGGNQQKVLIARALVADADIILLDDPTRGVDQPTKNALYETFREAARAGKLVIWRTSDDAELKYCTRLFVFNNGRIAGDIESAKSVDFGSVMKLSFENNETKKKSETSQKKRKAPLFTFALIAMIVIYCVCGRFSPLLFSGYGLQLMVTGFAALLLCAIAQTFIIGLGHVDLGVGNYCGLINVLICTWLFDSPVKGTIALIAAFLMYPLMGYVIQKRNVPAVIVTLGMSFVWIGLALSIQSMPGGTAPAWIRAVFYTDFGNMNTISIWLIVLFVIAVLIYRSKYGTVLRGFGNNESAMMNSGWSRARAFMTIYAIAGAFAFMAGIMCSAINNASDASASGTYTMLAVASTIIGGGYFSGGVVTLFGSVCGAVILSMVSVLLGLMKVSTDYTASIQGIVLIVILSLRLLKRKESKA